jgi:hypothetical protein
MSEPKLKAGTVADFAGSMAEAIETAFNTEWNNNKETPPASSDDRKILFAAIAQGILNYLKDNQNNMINSITFIDTTTNIETIETVSQLDLNA